MSDNFSKDFAEENKPQFWEKITIEKFSNEERIKIMSFSVKASENSDLKKLVIDLLISIAEKHGYASYFDSKQPDPLASYNLLF